MPVVLIFQPATDLEFTPIKVRVEILAGLADEIDDVGSRQTLRRLRRHTATLAQPRAEGHSTPFRNPVLVPYASPDWLGLPVPGPGPVTGSESGEGAREARG
jgi:hypothetical protein